MDTIKLPTVQVSRFLQTHSHDVIGVMIALAMLDLARAALFSAPIGSGVMIWVETQMGIAPTQMGVVWLLAACWMMFRMVYSVNVSLVERFIAVSPFLFYTAATVVWSFEVGADQPRTMYTLLYVLLLMIWVRE